MSYSQYGEEPIILEFFHGRVGRFLDVGAYDGVRMSNTRRLAELGWEGLCIEPNPNLFLRLNALYGHGPVKTLCALVWPFHEVRTLHMNVDGLSTCIARVFEDLVVVGIAFSGVTYAPTVTPQTLATLGPWDFVSIDAEGADVEIVLHGEAILAGAQLLCVEKHNPISRQVDADVVRIREACAERGFKTLVGETEGNLILAR